MRLALLRLEKRRELGERASPCLSNDAQALDWLEKAYERHDDWLIFLKVEPEFDRLRRHPVSALS